MHLSLKLSTLGLLHKDTLLPLLCVATFYPDPLQQRLAVLLQLLAGPVQRRSEGACGLPRVQLQPRVL